MSAHPRRTAAAAVKLVVTGPFAAGKTTFIRTISEITVVSTEQPVSDGGGKPETTVAMDFGRITLDRELVLYLFGTPGQDRFDFMWEVLGQGMLGYVLLVDSSRPDSLSSASAILSAFRSMSSTPFVVALNRSAAVDHGEDAQVRKALALPAEVPVLPCDATDRDSVKSVLLSLLYAVIDQLDRSKAPA